MISKLKVDFGPTWIFLNMKIMSIFLLPVPQMIEV